MTADVAEHVYVRFELEPDEDGWPPARSERLWAVPLDDHTARIGNVPWFVTDIACGDIVRTDRDDDGVRLFVEKVRWSGHCTIRIVPFTEGELRGDLRATLDLFEPLGGGEAIQQFGMVALDVPSTVDFPSVKALLERGLREGWWEYEEGCVGDAWLGAEAD